MTGASMGMVKRYLEDISCQSGYGGEINDFVSRVSKEAMERRLSPGKDDEEIEKIADRLSCRVYHDTKPNFGLSEILEEVGEDEKIKEYFPPFDPTRFELVAYVRIDSVDEAYRLTNNIDCPWWENEGVKVVKKSRSTSVGDVIVSPQGEVYLCKILGWEKLECKHFNEET